MHDKGHYYDRLRRQSKVYKENSFIVHDLHIEDNFDKNLKKLNDSKNYDKELYDKGMEYYNLGGILEEAKDELKNNRNFINGYNRAKRLAYIQEIEEKYNNKSR